MKRYYDEVRRLDSGMMSIDEFIRIFTDEAPSLTDVMVAYRIYREDGGRRYRWSDFAQYIQRYDIPEAYAIFVADEFLSEVRK